MDTVFEVDEVPNTEGRPPVQSAEFIRAFRRLLQDDLRWERDEAARSARDIWRSALELDTEVTRGQVPEPDVDAHIAETWWQRFFIEDTRYHLDQPEAWNHPIFQDFLRGWWHPSVGLRDNLASGASENTEMLGGRVAGSGLDDAGGPATGDVAGSGTDAAGGITANPPDIPAGSLRDRLTPRSEIRTQGNSQTNAENVTTPASPLGTPFNRRLRPGQLMTPETGVPRRQGLTTEQPASPSRSRPARTGSGTPPTTDLPPTQTQQPTGNITQPLQPNLSDMQEPHTWRDQRQPPMGARLLQILNWVNDEDIDRRRDWARELDEAEAWVREQLDRRDENRLGDDTITLLRQAEAAMQTHRRNERYHYRTFMGLKIPNPDELPKYAPRLPYSSENPIELGVEGPKSKTTRILLQLPDSPRPWRVVNNMWLTERERALNLTRRLPEERDDVLMGLADSEERLWAPQADQPPQTADNNLLLVENRSYSSAIANNDGTQFSRGWVYWREGTAEQEEARLLVDGTELRNTDRDFALERGARRAGLQSALRHFHSSENHMIANNGRMLVLPGGTKAEAVPDLEEVKRKAGLGNSRPIPLTELPANQMQRIDGKTDPQGFTANMAQWWREARKAMPTARQRTMGRAFRQSPEGALHPDPRQAHRSNAPESHFGPFVWRGVTAKVHLRQDCLRQMRGLKKLFDREKNIAPRKLLADMETAYQRGFRFEDPGDLLQLVDGRDRAASPPPGIDRDPEQNPHYLNKVELEWIRFLLNHSMTEGMASAALPRTALFLAFAQRLERIFNDPGDSLFPDTETSVTIEDLIAHMAKMKGPVHKTTFYVYDVKMFLERLAFQGRCRYVEDWRSYGRVQRPVLEYFPENLIIWRPRDQSSTDPQNYPEDTRPETPRFEDVQTWHDIVHQDPPENLPANVRVYFLCLAYRWGYGTKRLEAQENSWKTAPPLPLPRARGMLGRISNDFEFVMGGGEDPNKARTVVKDMERIWRKTLNKGDTEMPPDGESAIEHIRKAVLHEVVRADNMLYPGRSTNYLEALAPRMRESIWDWAKPQVRGTSKKFFSLNRWPVQLQSVDTQQRIKNDVDVDPDMLWNPIVEDPTPWTYYRPKARPYADDKVKFRTGDRLFPIGDTARQKEVVKNQVMAMVGSAMGIMPDDSPANDGVFSKLKGLLGFSKKRPRVLLDNPDDDDDDSVAHRHKLPRMNPSSIPPGADVVADYEAAMRAHEDATRLDVIPADQVPTGAQDVRFINRPVPNRDNALVVEQNLPL